MPFRATGKTKLRSSILREPNPIRTFATAYGGGCAVFARLQNALRKPRGFGTMLAENRYFKRDAPARTSAHATATRRSSTNLAFL